MNIFIPIGGIGKRFKDNGYHYPKPLINALGKPILFWLLECLKTQPDDHIYIAHHPELVTFDLQARIRRTFPGKTVEYIILQAPTRGAAETLQIMANNVPQSRKKLPCITLDSDTYYRTDVLQICRSMLSRPNTNGGVLCFETNDAEPIYSYTVANGEHIVKIAEKQKVSCLANTGCYLFQSVEWLSVHCNDYISQWNNHDSIEPYTSLLLMHTIEAVDAKLRYTVIAPSDFVVLGTPFQLKLYCHMNSAQINSYYRFCFDLDGTLVSRHHADVDYTNVSPIQSTVSFLRFLHDMGHTIIIYTARRMRTHQGNVGAVTADIGAQTIKTLKLFNIPYDELIFGKPYADFYIDDLAINPRTEDIAKTTGFYPTAVNARHFNSIRKTEIQIIEKTSTDLFTLEGEMYWYENVPPQIQDLFPRYYGRIHQGYRMEQLEGIAFSYFFQQGNLSVRHLELLMDGLDRIHGSANSGAPFDEHNLIYANYIAKMKQRQKQYAECYKKFDEVDDHFQRLERYFLDYETSEKGEMGVIHGDPVFSNVLLTDNERNVKFLDMRGRQGDHLTLIGDIHYDYAKVYQCLMGYDHILSGVPAQPASKTLMDYYWSRVGEDKRDIIVTICQSLVLTLIPLHEDSIHPLLWELFCQTIE